MLNGGCLVCSPERRQREDEETYREAAATSGRVRQDGVRSAPQDALHPPPGIDQKVKRTDKLALILGLVAMGGILAALWWWALVGLDEKIGQAWGGTCFACVFVAWILWMSGIGEK